MQRMAHRTLILCLCAVVCHIVTFHWMVSSHGISDWLSLCKWRRKTHLLSLLIPFFLETTMIIIVSTIHCWLGACTSIQRWINDLADKWIILFSLCIPLSFLLLLSQYTTTTTTICPLWNYFFLISFAFILFIPSSRLHRSTLFSVQ